jgi:hypothetical protein
MVRFWAAVARRSCGANPAQRATPAAEGTPLRPSRLATPTVKVFFSRHLPFTEPLYSYPRFCELLVRNRRSDWLRSGR